MSPPVTLTVHQGDDVGRPSVAVPASPGRAGVAVSGAAARLPGVPGSPHHRRGRTGSAQGAPIPTEQHPEAD